MRSRRWRRARKRGVKVASILAGGFADAGAAGASLQDELVRS